jgi:hypothetical protein
MTKMTAIVKSRNTLADDGVSVRVAQDGEILVAQMRCGDDWITLPNGVGSPFIEALKALNQLQRCGIVEYTHWTSDGMIGHIARMPNGKLTCYQRVGTKNEYSWRQPTAEEEAIILAGHAAVLNLEYGDEVIAYNEDMITGNQGWVEGEYVEKTDHGHRVDLVFWPGAPRAKTVVSCVKPLADAIREGMLFTKAA